MLKVSGYAETKNMKPETNWMSRFTKSGTRPIAHKTLSHRITLEIRPYLCERGADIGHDAPPDSYTATEITNTRALNRMPFLADGLYGGEGRESRLGFTQAGLRHPLRDVGFSDCSLGQLGLISSYCTHWYCIPVPTAAPIHCRRLEWLEFPGHPCPHCP